ncbi:MAG: hypothetical protein JSU96_17770 [Acidobacteriota bacterium]|nr:MAG: hypothetical protein JSU96_17770 [Acidobacteriota bacterium]
MFKQPDTVESDAELKEIFGEEAVISRVGKFNLIHLDHPSEDEIERRVEEFDPNDLLEDDCPLCRMLRDQGGNVVYDDY